MYTQFQRLLSTLLIGSMLLQGCGDPACKMMGSLGTSDEVNKSQPPSTTQDDSPERSVALDLAVPIGSFPEALGKTITGQCTTSQHPLVSPSPTLSDQPSSVRALQSLPPIKGTTHQPPKPPIEVNPSTNKISPKAFSAVPTYSIAHGQQVSFEEQGGRWMAQVKDRWGRIQKLPVVCAPDQTPEQTIALLASKTLNQYKYCIHMLDTNQSPWASRVVYVGALGLRGGGRDDLHDFFYKGMASINRDRSIQEQMRNTGRSREEAEQIHDFVRDGMASVNRDRSIQEQMRNTGRSREEAEQIHDFVRDGMASAYRAGTGTQFSGRQSDDFSQRSRQRAEEQHARAVWEAEQERAREEWEREQERERRAREEWEREQEQKRHAREEKHDYEAFCRRETTTSPTAKNTRRQQRDESPKRYAWEPGQEEALSKQAYFQWKEQEEIRIAKEAQEQARQFYFSKWQQQEPRRRAEERRSRLDEAYRREERRRQEAPRREREERRVRLDEAYRREERRRQEAPRREREERRVRLDEIHRREEERRRREAEARNMPATSATATAPDTRKVSSVAQAQEDEDDNVEEVYTDYPAMHANASPPSTDPSPNERPTSWQPPFVARAATEPSNQEIASGARRPEVSDPEVEERCILPPYGAPFDINKKTFGGRVVPSRFLVDKEGNLRPCTDEERSMLKESREAFKKRFFDDALKLPATPTPLPASSMPRSMFERMHRSVKIPPLYPESSTPGVVSVAEEPKEDAPVPVVDEDRKLPAKPTASTKQEVASTDTAIQQQRSGAVVSQGLVLDSEGKLQPHEVRVPFAVPRAYQAFPETKPHPSAQDAREQGIAQSVLQSVAAYREACEADAGFQQQRSALTKVEEQLKSDTTNEVLSRQYQEQEAVFQQHPLYQQGCALAKEAQKLREAESTKADHIILSKAEMQLGVGREKIKQRKQHRQAASDIRDELLQPVRQILERPSTPPKTRLAGQFAKGVGESAVATAKLAVDIPVVAAKLIGKGIHSLATWEDKLGIGEKLTDASEVVKAFCEERKYEWENPAEYQERLQATQQYRKKLDIAERALNAEAYHNRDARNMGYWSGEALQAVFGEEVVKGGVKLARGAQKAAKVAKASQTAAQSAKAAKRVAKQAEGVEAGVAQAAKVEQAAQRAEGVEHITKVAKAAESVEGTARTEQIIQDASPQVQEAYASTKAWLGEGCRAIVNEQGDLILMSKDGLRKFRTDFYDKKYPKLY